ncbi:hypothetical protein HA402_003533 [Bradysia odoriphaga]|nr:hypothetical protein HA402_003533 [Bradysia odoriphaga]
MPNTSDTDTEDIIRPMHCELHALTRSDGSALLTQGETAVMASVYGPIEVRLQNLRIDKAHVEVYYRPKSGLPSVGDRLREQMIRNTCETALLSVLYPRTAITIQLQEMEDNEGLIACSVNAACLALISSGLSMKFLIGAVHCIVDANSDIILDPNTRQSAEAVAHFTFVFDSVQKSTVALHTSGKYTIGQYNDALIRCKEACHLVFQFYKEAVKKFAKIL